MHDTITDLYYGDIQPYEERRFSDSEYSEALRLFDRLYDEVMEKLSDSELQERFDDALAELTQAGERIMFCRGFRLGLRLAAESFLNA